MAKAAARAKNTRFIAILREKWSGPLALRIALRFLEDDAVARGHEVAQDRERDLRRRARADRQSHGPAQARDLRRQQIEIGEALAPLGAGARRADRADVERVA